MAEFLGSEELEAGLNICAAATPGPWEQRAIDGMSCDFVVAGQVVICCHLNPMDARFIAASRGAVPLLIEQVKMLHGVVVRLEGELREAKRLLKLNGVM